MHMAACMMPMPAAEPTHRGWHAVKPKRAFIATMVGSHYEAAKPPGGKYNKNDAMGGPMINTGGEKNAKIPKKVEV